MCRLVAAMVWFVRIGFLGAGKVTIQQSAEEIPAQGYGLWKARLAMIAVFVTPLMIAWAEFGGDAPKSVRTYRLLLTVGVMIVMGVLVVLKQHLSGPGITKPFALSRQSLDETCRLKRRLGEQRAFAAVA